MGREVWERERHAEKGPRRPPGEGRGPLGDDPCGVRRADVEEPFSLASAGTSRQIHRPLLAPDSSSLLSVAYCQGLSKTRFVRSTVLVAYVSLQIVG